MFAKVSETPTPARVFCKGNAQPFYLTLPEYKRQLKEGSWTCPSCRGPAEFDQENYERHQEAFLDDINVLVIDNEGIRSLQGDDLLSALNQLFGPPPTALPKKDAVKASLANIIHELREHKKQFVGKEDDFIIHLGSSGVHVTINDYLDAVNFAVVTLSSVKL